MTVQSPQQFRFNKLHRLAHLLVNLLVVLGLIVFGLSYAQAEDALPPPGHLNDSPDAPADNLPTTPPSAEPADGLPAPGNLVDAEANTTPETEPAALQLEVSINTYKTNLVAGFNPLPDGSLTSARSELTEIGIKVPGQGAKNEQIPLTSIPGLTYSFDEATLSINLNVEDRARIPKVYDILPQQEMVRADGGYGFVMNYSAYSAINAKLLGITPSFSGASVNLDAHAYAPFGVFRQTAAIGTTTFSRFATTRLDSTWTTSNQDRAETYRLGDLVSNGLNWTRPVRMGGVQAQRDFGVRPDLVTSPLANLSGTAAVPSTLDVFINGTKTLSENVPQGPFEINRLPIISSQGTAQIVVTDPSGRKTVTEQAVYSSPLLLAPKLFDYSVEVGLPRLNYGAESFDYGRDIMAIVSGRYGFNKSLTGEFHLEAKRDLVDAGLGTVFQAGPFGTFNVAAAFSNYRGKLGYYGFGAWDYRSKNVMVRASTARTFGKFTDLAAATALNAPTAPGMPATALLGSGVPKAIDQIGASYGFTDYDAAVGFNLVHYVTQADTKSFILSASASKSFHNHMSFFAAAYKDLADDNNYGMQIGFSMPLGAPEKNISLSSSATYDNNGPSIQASAVKPMEANYGSLGWRVNAIKNKGRNVSAAATYRAQKAIISGSAENTDQQSRADMRVDGSVIVAKSGLFFGNPVADSFAVVDAGTEGVGIEYENRFVGKTGKNGKLLLTQVPSYRPTKVSLQPTTLPLNSNVTEVDKKIAPRAMSGVVIDFGVKKETGSALVILQDAKGTFLPPGTLVSLEGQQEPFPMGYDGQVYVTGLSPKNVLSANVAGQVCTVSFDYKEIDTEQVLIGPLQCV